MIACFLGVRRRCRWLVVAGLLSLSLSVGGLARVPLLAAQTPAPAGGSAPQAYLAAVGARASAPSPAVGLVDERYGFDVAGNVVSRTARVVGVGVFTDRASFDGLGRLSSVVSSGPDGAGSVSYSYDRAGNRTGVTSAGAGGVSVQTVVFDGADRPLRTVTSGAVSTASVYAYDGAGRVSGVASWVPSDGFPAAGVPPAGAVVTSYTYTVDGLLASVSTPERAVSYSYDGLGRPVGVTTSTPVSAHAARWVFDGWSPVAALDDVFGWSGYYMDVAGQSLGQTSASGAVWHVTDVLGSVVVQDPSAQGQPGVLAAGVVAATEAMRWGPWGERQFHSAGWDADVGFTGQRVESGTGLGLFPARAYHPGTSWLQPDLFPGVLSDPSSLNRQAYVSNNPLTVTDPTGNCPWCIPIGFGGGLAGYLIYRHVTPADQRSPEKAIAWTVGGAVATTLLVGTAPVWVPIVGGRLLGRYVGPMIGRLVRAGQPALPPAGTVAPSSGSSLWTGLGSMLGGLALGGIAKGAINNTKQPNGNNNTSGGRYNGSNATPNPAPPANQGRVPPKADSVLRQVDATGQPPQGYSGGGTFQNREGLLPSTDSRGNPITYREWDVDPTGSGPRNAERIVTGSDGSAYYTSDHYASFIRMR